MKRFYLYCLTLVVVSCCKEKDDPVVPEDPIPVIYSFNGEIGVNDNSTIASADDNLLICGNKSDTISVLKISKTGASIWQRDFRTSGGRAWGIAEAGNQEIFVCGTTYRNDEASKADVLLVKLNSNGDTIWTKTYGGIEDEFGYYIITTQDGNLLICGTTDSNTSDGYNNIYLIKTNTNGDTIWTKTLLEPDQEHPYHILQTQNGEFLVTGTHTVSGAGKELYLIKISEIGTPLWNKKIDSQVGKWGLSTVELTNGDLMTCGKIANDTDTQVLLIKTDGLGNTYWEKEFGETYLDEQANAIQLNADGSYSLTGGFKEQHSGQSQILLIKVDQNGNLLFSKSFGGHILTYGQNIIKDVNDDNLITGQSNFSIFMTRTDNNGVFK